MGKSQQTKGKTGEREVVKLLASHGFIARRGQVWMGEGDIVAPAFPFHLEVKRHETIELAKWFDQAKRDAGRKYPAVVFRQNRRPWMIALRAMDFADFVRADGWIEHDHLMLMKFEEFLDVAKDVLSDE